MTRRLALRWPNSRPFHRHGGRPLRLLAVSDEIDPALEVLANRDALEPVDLVVGCGDLAPDWLGFLADAFRAPLTYVRGNHDRRGPWPFPPGIPAPSSGWVDRLVPGVPILALPWPGRDGEPARRDERAAWGQVLGRVLLRPPNPAVGAIIVSHVPPRGAGDTPGDEYHVGFAAYAFALRRVQPVVWLHGHTTRAAQRDWRTQRGATTLVNVTGSVLVELTSPDAADGVPGEAGGLRSSAEGR
ncbi:MAG TPA: metallophosphoesterase [Candidatus Limnocylindria bacterium]